MARRRSPFTEPAVAAENADSPKNAWHSATKPACARSASRTRATADGGNLSEFLLPGRAAKSKCLLPSRKCARAPSNPALIQGSVGLSAAIVHGPSGVSTVA